MNKQKCPEYPWVPPIYLEDRDTGPSAEIYKALEVVAGSSSRPILATFFPRTTASTAWWYTSQPWWSIRGSPVTPTYEPVWYPAAPEVAQDTPCLAPPFSKARALLLLALLAMIPQGQSLEE